MPAFKRGISMELWTSWPGEAEWSNAEKLFPFPEWRRVVSQPDLAALKAAGLDFVRLPIDPGVFFAASAAPFQDRLMTEIEATVADLRAAGLNVMVDLHTIPGGDSRPASIERVLADDAAFDRYIDVAVRFALRFAKADGVALELINEPVIDCEPGQNRWPAMISRLHAAARKAAPRLPLVVTGACWGDGDRLAELPQDVIGDPLALFSFHSYAPFLLTHQGATWAGDFIPHVTGLPFPPDRYSAGDFASAVRAVKRRIAEKAPTGRVAGLTSYLDELVAEIDTAEELAAAMEKPFTAVARFAADNAIAPDRIILGEFGMIRQEWGNPFIMPADWRADYMAAKKAIAEKHGFGWAIWGYSGAFGVVQGFGGEALGDGLLERVIGTP